MTDNQRVAEWLVFNGFPNSVDHCGYVIWYGGRGVLARIREIAPYIWHEFITMLVTNMEPKQVIAVEDDGSDWIGLDTAMLVLESNPAQLAAALAKVIEEEEES